MVGVLLLFIWTVVGLSLYIPLLIRVMAGYTVALTNATITGRGTEHAQAQLEKAIEFFPDGFVRIFRILDQPSKTTTPLPRRTDLSSFERLIGEVAWAIVVWGVPLGIYFRYSLATFLSEFYGTLLVLALLGLVGMAGVVIWRKWL